MQLSTVALLTALFGSGARAVFVCGGYIEETGGCDATTCQEFFIGVGDTLNPGDFNCVFNAASDTGFDLVVCAEEDLAGSCAYLSNLPMTLVNDNFNWKTVGSKSMKRTGN